MEKETKADTIDGYIANYSGKVAEILQKVRKTIAKAAPDATEKISWQMPTFYQNGNLVHFSAHKKHIGLYPGSEAIEAFKFRFIEKNYKFSKGAVQFPFDREIPYEMIKDIVEFCVNKRE